MKHIFGPVPSRRLGLSLGIDLIPFKTCTLDCLYCECGATTDHITDRREFYPVSEIIKELDYFLNKNPKLDYITFSGSGEPTLYKGIDKITSFIKKNYPQYKVALLTNGTLLYDRNVREELIGIDLIIPSLDSVVDEEFQAINRPSKNSSLEKLLLGINELKKEYKGSIWIEFFVIPGMNDSEESLLKLKEYLTALNPDNIQLNRLDRPGTDRKIERATDEEIQRVKKFLEPLPVEKIYAFSGSESELFDKDFEDKVVALIKIRPVNMSDLVKLTGKSILEITKFMDILRNKDKMEEILQDGKTFYKLR